MHMQGMHEHDGFAPHSHEVRADHRGVKRNEVMDRAANNDRLKTIVQENRMEDGTIPSRNIAPMIRRLTALLDEVADGMYQAGADGLRGASGS